MARLQLLGTYHASCIALQLLSHLLYTTNKLHLHDATQSRSIRSEESRESTVLQNCTLGRTRDWNLAILQHGKLNQDAGLIEMMKCNPHPVQAPAGLQSCISHIARAFTFAACNGEASQDSTISHQFEPRQLSNSCLEGRPAFSGQPCHTLG